MPDQDIDKGGRPSAFKDEYIYQAYTVCADDGYTNVKLAKLFKVDVRTIGNWLKGIPEFKEAVLKGKDDYDSMFVEKSLLKRAVGFRYTETTREAGDNGVMAITKKVSKLVVPDTKACEIWLCNRQPGRWKRIKHVEVSGAGGGPIKTQELTNFPNEPKTIKEWEEQVRDAEGAETDEKTSSS